MSRLRISAISFLNTAPLMWDFENGETADRLRQHFETSYTIPSRCAEQLKEGLADIGIIPVAAYTVIPDLVIVPDVAISAKNKVRSILLVSKVPIDKIRSVATDDSSRTSAALVEIYLRKFVGIDAGFTRQKPSLKEMLQWHDAAMLIGDPALQARTDGYFVYDLAEEWKRWTGRPFVFAFWAVRKAALQGRDGEPNIAQVFQQSLKGQGWLLLATVVVIYLVLSILYESFIHPITILSGLPAAGVGALLTLMLFKMDLSVIAIIGVIMLVGIVKKNAIMMIDFAIDAQRNRGEPPERAIHQACMLRFRPIMMTTMAAIMGTLPIALGLGAGAEYGGAVEVNGNPWRLYLDWRWLRRGMELGCKFSINPDAHSTDEIASSTLWGLGIARKSGIPADRVINTLDRASFARWLQARKEQASPSRKHTRNRKPQAA